MKTKAGTIIFLWLFAGTLFLDASIRTSAHADLTYTMTITPPGAALDLLTTTATVSLRGVRKRVDMHGDGLNITTICCPDLGEVYTIDSSLAIYKEEPIHTVVQLFAIPDVPVLARSGDSDHWSSDTRTVIEAEGMQKQTVEDIPTDRLRLTLHDNLRGPSDTTHDVVLDYWVAEKATAYAAKPTSSIDRPDGTTLTYTMSGDSGLIDDLTQRMPVRIIVHSAGRGDTTMTLIDESTAQLSSAAFDLPAGCTMVSSKEFNASEHPTNPHSDLLNNHPLPPGYGADDSE